MDIGISALPFQLDDAIDICKTYNNINHIEIGIDNLEDCKIVKSYLEDIKKLNLSIGIHLPMELNTCENINYISNSWVIFIEKINNELSEFNVKYYNMHLGYAITSRYLNKKQNYLDNSVKFLNKLANKLNCSITIENTYSNGGDISNIGTSVDEFEYIFNNVNKDNIKFCYDSGHNLINKSNYLNNLNSMIEVVHLSDNDGKKDIHIGLGKGKLDLNEVINIINLKVKTVVLEINYLEIKNSLDILENLLNWRE